MIPKNDFLPALLAFSRSAHRQLASAILIVNFAGQTFAAESFEQTVNYLIDTSPN
jgi:hypothetical protein